MEEEKEEEARREWQSAYVLTVAEEGFLVVQEFGAVLTGCGRRGADWYKEVTVCTLLFSLFTLPLPLPFLLLLLEATKRDGKSNERKYSRTSTVL